MAPQACLALSGSLGPIRIWCVSGMHWRDLGNVGGCGCTRILSVRHAQVKGVGQCRTVVQVRRDRLLRARPRRFTTTTHGTK